MFLTSFSLLHHNNKFYLNMEISNSELNADNPIIPLNILQLKIGKIPTQKMYQNSKKIT